jgi:hypothetical protein
MVKRTNKMKGTLNKLDNGWMLLIDNVIYATDNDKLSIKNCQAIENGYDLDELARNYVDEQPNDFLYTTDEYWNAQVDFQKGFRKAMELMESKKYSEEDIKKAIFTAWDNDNITSVSIVQSLQPKEWEVEILEELDKDGCLILKRL